MGARPESGARGRRSFMNRRLRNLAEEQISRGADPPVQRVEVEDVAHELHVHQVELEIQNEELRDSQEQLRQSRDEYRQLYEGAPVGYITLGREGQILRYNQTFLRVVGVDVPARSQVFLTDFLDPAGRQVFNSRFRSFFRSATPPAMDLELADHRYIQLHGVSTGDPAMKDSSLLAAVVDITVQRQAEQRVHRLLEEKDLLLRELHHRIKNSLGLVAAELSIQVDHHAVETPAAAAALDDARERVLAMQSVYQVLEGNHRYPTMAISPYLGQLLEEVRRTLPRGWQLTFHHQEVTAELSVQRAVILGLVVHELVINAVKHGFVASPQVDPPQIVVELRHRSDQRLELTVKDNGVGITADAGDCDNSPRSAGISMAKMLARNLEGTITWCTADPRSPGGKPHHQEDGSCACGTCIQLIFPAGGHGAPG